MRTGMARTAEQSKARRIGRPRSIDPTGRKAATRRVSVLVTDEQHAALMREARAAGVSVATLVRSRLAA